MGGRTSEEQLLPGRLQMNVIRAVSPHHVSHLYTERRRWQILFVLFAFTSEGEDEVKKVQFFN